MADSLETQDPAPLELAPLREIVNALPDEGPWAALGTGVAGGDHWYVCNDGEAIASIACQDGINEDEREPRARHMAAFDKPTATALLDLAEGEAETTEINNRLSVILRATANALKGEPEPLTAHSWHDLAEVATALQARAEAAEAKLKVIREHCGTAEWMTDEDGDQWLAVTVGLLRKTVGDGHE